MIMTISSNAFGDAALGDQIPLVGAIGLRPVGAASSRCSSAGWRSRSRRSSGGPARRPLPGIVMVVLWVANGLDIGGPLVNVSPFRWTADHIPLAGLYDWAGSVAGPGRGVVLLAVGVELFSRRDLGVTADVSLPHCRTRSSGSAGRSARAFGEQLPRALAWGLGPRAHGRPPGVAGGLVRQADRRATRACSRRSPRSSRASTSPSAGGLLQLYVELFYIAAGFAARDVRRRNGRRTRPTAGSRRSLPARCRRPAG